MGTLVEILLLWIVVMVSCATELCAESAKKADPWWEIENGTIHTLCDNSEVRRSTSPSGAIDLVIFTQTCFRKEHGYCSLVPTGEPINRRHGNLGDFYPRYNNPEDISVTWGHDDTLLLTVRSFDMTWLYDQPTRSTVLRTVRDLAGESILVQVEEDPALPERDCFNRDVSRTASPNGQFDLVVFERICETEVNGGLAVLPSGQEVGHRMMTAFDLRSNPWSGIRPRWTSEQTAVIELPNPPIPEARVLGVRVTLVKPGTH